MAEPIKLKAKCDNGHRIWAWRTEIGHTTGCRFKNCNDVPRERIK